MRVKELRNFRNPRLTSDSRGILLDVELVWEDGTVEPSTFCAMSDDTADYGRALYARAQAGEFGPVAAAPEPPP